MGKNVKKGVSEVHDLKGWMLGIAASLKAVFGTDAEMEQPMCNGIGKPKPNAKSFTSKVELAANIVEAHRALGEMTSSAERLSKSLAKAPKPSDEVLLQIIKDL